MTEPKRWSSSGSEVDAVLRSVLLYGRNLAPNSQQLQAILRGAERRHPSAKRPRLMAFVLAGAAAACAGLAWAGYAGGLLFSSPPPAPAAVAPSQVKPPTAKRPAANLPVGPASANWPRGTTLPAAPPSRAPAAGHQPVAANVELAAPSVAASASLPAEQDAALLQQAQRLVTSDPGRALTLTRDHELHFPSSPLLEERQALRIEALARLGRRSEAGRGLATFDQHFPHSIYRHRLHDLLPD